MAELRKADAERLLEFVGDAHTVDGQEAFTTELLDRFAETMKSEFAAYFEFDAESPAAHPRITVTNSRSKRYVHPPWPHRPPEVPLWAIRPLGDVSFWSDDFERADEVAVRDSAVDEDVGSGRLCLGDTSGRRLGTRRRLSLPPGARLQRARPQGHERARSARNSADPKRPRPTAARGSRRDRGRRRQRRIDSRLHPPQRQARGRARLARGPPNPQLLVRPPGESLAVAARGVVALRRATQTAQPRAQRHTSSCSKHRHRIHSS